MDMRFTTHSVLMAERFTDVIHRFDIIQRKRIGRTKREHDGWHNLLLLKAATELAMQINQVNFVIVIDSDTDHL